MCICLFCALVPIKVIINNNNYPPLTVYLYRIYPILSRTLLKANNSSIALLFIKGILYASAFALSGHLIHAETTGQERLKSEQQVRGGRMLSVY